MKNYLLNLAGNRQENNLNAVRLVLAILVILDHSFVLSTGTKSDPLFFFSHYQISFGDLAVDLFFFISGLLITASWLNCPTMDDYMRRRILRIFPGYFSALLLSFLVATVFASHPFSNLGQHFLKIGDLPTMGYFSLVGDWIFPNNPYPSLANGSLWTIIWEFTFYLVVAFVGLFGLFKRRVFVLGAFTLFFATFCFDPSYALKFFVFFLAGSCAWLWRDRIIISHTWGLLALFVCLVTTQYSPLFNLLGPLIAGYAVLWIGFAGRINCMAWCNKTDLSYGVYLFAFPLQQVLAWMGIRNPWLMFALAAPLTLVIAFFSWNFMEKPCLKLKSRDFRGHEPVGAADASPAPIARNPNINW